jgi:virulence factor Mce-like protein
MATVTKPRPTRREPATVRRRRGRFTFVPGEHRPNKVRNGAIFLLLLGIVLYSGFNRHLLFWPYSGTNVRAEFASAANVRPGTEVRVAGVPVGEVTSVSQAASGDAQVTMRIDSGEAAHIYTDARAHIYWRTLLGRNMYVQIDPGTSGHRLAGAVIPTSRTDTQVEFDQLLQPLDKGGIPALQHVIGGLSTGFADSAAVRGTVRQLGPATTQLAPALDGALGTQTGDLDRLVEGLKGPMATLAANDAALGDLVSNGSAAIGTLAAQRLALGATLGDAPGALTEVRLSTARLTRTLNNLDPVTLALMPGVRRLQAAAGAAQPALSQLAVDLRVGRPLLQNLPPAVARLKAAAVAGSADIQQLTPVADRLGSSIVPWLGQRSADTKLLNYQAIGPAVAAVDASSMDYDANGFIQRFAGGVGEGVIGSLPCRTFITDPSATQLLTCDSLQSVLARLLGASGSK